jgi:two-component system cell cycle response regulator DivK
MTPLRVLVIDDHVLNLELAAYVLREDGVEVDTADGAAAALSSIATRRPDLVLMDVQMPDMDGLTLTRRLKSDPATAGIVIVAFTAHAMKGDEQRMREAGCDGYIAKPIDVAGFAAQVRALAMAGGQ